jgi:S1-C subfamily serine protease
MCAWWDEQHLVGFREGRMNRIALAAALALTTALAAVDAARASVPLPVIEQTTGTPTLAPVLKKIMPSVVSISTRGAPEASAQQKKPRETKRLEAASARAAGSGVIVDARQGLIVTNNHVIQHADDITVTLVDGREFVAKLVGGDPDTDVAVIKIATDNLTAILIGNSDRVEVGDFVLAVGNPFMIGQTVTSGIVSGLNRNNVGLEEIENFIQTDAAIYPGNSGGALINLRGELIGINTAFLGATNANPGMGFAIPINMVRTVVDRILEIGDVRRGKLGIAFEDVTPIHVREFRLPASTPANAVVITKVEAGSSADHAGLKAGDIVADLGVMPVRDTNDLHARLGLLWVGDTAEFTVVRDGKAMDLHATIVDTPRSEQRAKSK